MSRSDDAFKTALEGKQIPLLTLDNKWHRLFTQADSNACIKKLEKELNELIKRQGKLTTESKDIKKIKNKLMEEIREAATAEETIMDKTAEKKIAENKRLLSECNDKLEAYQDELLELPNEIHRINSELMLQTMDICYETLQDNSKEIAEIAQWITEIRIELKKKVIRKQEMEWKNQELYTYMHAIFGADVINIFDMKYNPGEQQLKKSEKPEE